jgi:hypothetical protein
MPSSVEHTCTHAVSPPPLPHKHNDAQVNALPKTHTQLTLAAVPAVVASTLLILAHTLVLRLAHKPASLAALVCVLTGCAVTALVV